MILCFSAKQNLKQWPSLQKTHVYCLDNMFYYRYSPSVFNESNPLLFQQKIKRVYTSEFKPYVVFVKPPRIEELRLTRRRAKFVCDEEDTNQVRIFSVRKNTHSPAIAWCIKVPVPCNTHDSMRTNIVAHAPN